MKNHEAGVGEDVRQCYTIGEHGKTQRHDRLARVGSVAGELVPLVVVDEDGRDVVVFLDEFEFGWRGATAHGCTRLRLHLRLFGSSYALRRAISCRVVQAWQHNLANAGLELQLFACSQSVGTRRLACDCCLRLMQCCERAWANAILAAESCSIVACGVLAVIFAAIARNTHRRTPIGEQSVS